VSAVNSEHKETTCALAKTKKRVLTRRGVIWLGQTCNQRCYFCYFATRIADRSHPEHAFMDLVKAKKLCKTLRYFYGNTSVDIQGGEPTIHPDILELTRYCGEIGLYPTLITNGLVLGKPGLVEKYREAGVRDFLVSFHGIGEIHDQVVGVDGAYARIVAGVERMREAGMPFRFNCTMSKPVIPVLPEIARKAIEYGAYAVNYIAFNPFGDQEQGVRTRENVALYSEIKPRLAESIDALEAAGIETNVRYLPLCMAEPRHRKNFYNYQQLPYDTHEWDYASWLWTMMQTQMMKAGNTMPPFPIGYGARRISQSNPSFLRDAYDNGVLKYRLKFAVQRLLANVEKLFRGREALLREQAHFHAADCNYKFGETCGRCNARKICDGFHGDYANFFGCDEANAINDIPLTDDTKFYIQHQEKTVEPEDAPWAL
jgi:molybdenum cofactor biosynthesis enzyme MoaA